MRVITFDAARRLRWRVASVVAVMVLFVVAGPVAEAKMPPFEIDVDVDGTTATITVVIDDQYGFDAADLDGLLAVYPESGLDERLRPDRESVAIEVGLDRAGTGLYWGTVDLERAGRWAVVPFPTSADVPFQLFYPNTIMFETTANSARLWVAGVGLGSALLLIFGGRSRNLQWLLRPFVIATVRKERWLLVWVGLSGLAADNHHFIGVCRRWETSIELGVDHCQQIAGASHRSRHLEIRTGDEILHRSG
jgi:hypothetical protein